MPIPFGSRYYILRDRIAIPCNDPIAAMLDPNSGIGTKVAETTIGDGACYVSTVFLALNHNFRGGDPLLFETMAFLADEEDPGKLGKSTHMRRYSTWADAEAGHQSLVRSLEVEYEVSHLITADMLAKHAVPG